MLEQTVPEKYRVPALERMSLVLDAVSRSSEGLRLSDLARMIDLPKSTLHNLLLTMEGLGLLTREADGGPVRLGLRLYEWGVAYSRQMDLLGQFNRLASDLARRCQETIQLAVLDGRDVVYLAKQDPEDQAIRLVSEPGKRLPASATALGKILMAYLPEEEVSNRFKDAEWIRMTAHTIMDLPRLLEELRMARNEGLAHDHQEVAEGLECMAAPILDHMGRASAAVSVSTPIYRLTEERRTMLEAEIRSLAAELSRLSGHGISHTGAKAP